MKFISEPAMPGIYSINGLPTGLKIGMIGRYANFTDYSQNLRIIRNEEFRLLEKTTGLPAKNILFMNQMHADKTLKIKKMPGMATEYIGDFDAMATHLKKVCLVVRTADCAPVLLYSKNKNVIAAVHSGWRGTELEIAGKTLNILKKDYKCDHTDTIACILPCIGPESYEIGSDVADKFKGHISSSGGKFYLDLWSAIEATLIKYGLRKDMIFNTGICTLKEKARFFSHRGGDTGRNLNFIYMV